jgi:hypothetical protein
MAAGSTYTPIQTTTLGSNQSSVTLSSIASTYTDIILIVNATWTSTTGNAYVRVNGDTASNYSFIRMTGNGTTATSGKSTSQTSILNMFDIENPTTTGGVYIFQFMNYANTSINKTILTRTGQASDTTKLYASLWRSTSAINSISFTMDSANMATGSTLTLYGIAAA